MVDRAAVEAWVADEVSADDAAELRAVTSQAELDDRFRGPLTFGTAGLRGPLRAGPNGMNAAVVRRAAAGLASWLGSGRVIVGYDARHRSYEFAHDSAAVFAGAGFKALVLPRALPTPVLAFAVQHLRCAAGVMVTASHNPPQDNGYKVYLADGAQLAPPTDVAIEAAIRAVPSARGVPTSDRYTVLGDEIEDAYVAAVADLVPTRPRMLRLVHTALHGVGTHVLRRVFDRAGFSEVTSVAQQSAPNPDFPTVSFPNPEEPGALDLALALAGTIGADLLIANDPDADRCSVAIPVGTGWRQLSGDEVGVVLADDLMRRGVRGTYATTVVSSTLLGRMAAARGFPYAETLTGFKWIARAAPDLAFGYEEALGYAVAPDLVRDKDGISAALLVADLATRLAEAGSSLQDRLDSIAAEFGATVTGQLSYRVADVSVIDAAMRSLRASPPASLLSVPVTTTDRLPDADVLTLRAGRARAVVRPSGTEPKLKVYLEVVGSSDDLARLRAEMASLLAPSFASY